MITFIIRRLLIAIPTLVIISLVVFLLLNLAPNDPMAQVPLTVPPEVKQKMREALGLGQPIHIQFFKWLVQFFWIEPQVLIDYLFNTTFWVVGMSYVVGILIALPIGLYSAYKQYSIFDNVGTFVSMVGYSVPPFFSGVFVIVIFSVQLGWLPSIYDTTHTVVDWETFKFQVKQMVMPVMVLALQTTAQINRFMRSASLDNLNQDYVRTARAKGLTEWTIITVHVLRNSMIPVVTVIAINVPYIFGGALITEQVFKVNGIGHQLIGAIYANDLPTVQTITFMFAFLIVSFNLLADIIYGLLDPRIRYD